MPAQEAARAKKEKDEKDLRRNNIKLDPTGRSIADELAALLPSLVQSGSAGFAGSLDTFKAVRASAAERRKNAQERLERGSAAYLDQRVVSSETPAGMVGQGGRAAQRQPAGPNQSSPNQSSPNQSSPNQSSRADTRREEPRFLDEQHGLDRTDARPNLSATLPAFAADIAGEHPSEAARNRAAERAVAARPAAIDFAAHPAAIDFEARKSGDETKKTFENKTFADPRIDPETLLFEADPRRPMDLKPLMARAADLAPETLLLAVAATRRAQADNRAAMAKRLDPIVMERDRMLGAGLDVLSREATMRGIALPPVAAPEAPDRSSDVAERQTARSSGAGYGR
jgi:hypothetical protein